MNGSHPSTVLFIHTRACTHACTQRKHLRKLGGGGVVVSDIKATSITSVRLKSSSVLGFVVYLACVVKRPRSC